METPVPAAKPNRAPLFALAVGMILVASFEVFSTLRDPRNLAFVAGHALPITILVWLVVWLAFIRPAKQRFAGRAWLAIFAAGLIGGGVTLGYHQLQSPAGPQAKAGAPRTDDSAVASEAKSMLLLMGAEVAKQDADFRAELKASGYASVLEPAALNADPDLSDAPQKVRAAKQIIQKYRELKAKQIAAVPGMVDDLKIDPAAKAEMKATLAQSMAANQPVIDRIWFLEDARADETGRAADFLKAKRTAWHVVGDTIVFDEPADIARYQQIIAKIGQTIDEEIAIKTKGASKANSGLKKLDEVAK